MATEAELQQKFSDLASEFQALQAQVAVASQNCAIDKASALAAFTSIIAGFNSLLNKATTLKAEASAAGFSATVSSVGAFTVSITQALSDAAKAQSTCEKSTVQPPGASGATGATTPTAAAPLDEVTITSKRVNANKEEARSAASQSEAYNLAQKGDWRVRLALAPGANYLYKDSSNEILAPLRATEGIVFPYTPSIQIQYSANYDQTAVQHSNYKIFQYQNSSVENITVTCDFTAQDTFEAKYVLAVIHFLRAATKMFYGQDSDPRAGIPPPLCYLYGMGQFQFSGQPLVINNFTYSLPTDVDYIRTIQGQTMAVNQVSSTGGQGAGSKQQQRMGEQVAPGGGKPPAALSSGDGPTPTYVPTKIQLSFSAYPVVARNEVSNKFSFKEYANGNLLTAKGGGFW